MQLDQPGIAGLFLLRVFNPGLCAKRESQKTTRYAGGGPLALRARLAPPVQ